MADLAKMKERKGEPFALKEFLDQVNTIGCIPLALTRREILAK